MAYRGRIVWLPVELIESLGDFLAGIDITVEREDDRLCAGSMSQILI